MTSYRVYSVNANGTSSASTAPAYVNTIQPSTPWVQSITASSVQVGWQPYLTDYSGSCQISLLRSTSPVGPFAPVQTLGDTCFSNTSQSPAYLTDFTVTPNTTYYYEVQITNGQWTTLVSGPT